MNAQLDSMIAELSRGDPKYLPSKYWQVLNQKNTEQLEKDGLANFKQTLALNYFTWVVGRKTDQFRWLKKQTGFLMWLKIRFDARQYDDKLPLTRKQQDEFITFNRMLWNVAEREDREGLLKSLEEPAVGNPFKFYWKGRLISQDLANSVLEYYSMREHFVPVSGKRMTICELGAGYGRNGFVFLKAVPNCKYIIVDIPPALYVSQHYLTSVFPERKAFTFRSFENFSQVEAEFKAADMVFLLPHQLEKLPPKCVDLFVNISSLHEMNPVQIKVYFELIDRMTSGLFYTKQWKVSKIPHENIEVRREDYPVRPTWRQLFSREAKVQVAFFEAMYAIPGS